MLSDLTHTLVDAATLFFAGVGIVTCWWCCVHRRVVRLWIACKCLLAILLLSVVPICGLAALVILQLHCE